MRPIHPTQRVQRLLIGRDNRIVRLRRPLYSARETTYIESGGLRYILFDGKGYGVYSKDPSGKYRREGMLDHEHHVKMSLGTCVSLIALRQGEHQQSEHALEGILAHIAIPSAYRAGSQPIVDKPAAFTDMALKKIEEGFGTAKKRFIVIPATTSNLVTNEITEEIMKYAHEKKIPVVVPPERRLIVKGKHVSLFNLHKKGNEVYGLHIERV